MGFIDDHYQFYIIPGPGVRLIDGDIVLLHACAREVVRKPISAGGG